MIGIIDYRMCNLQSVKNSLDYLKIKNQFINSPSDIKKCDKLILPGVGAFGLAMERLNKIGFSSKIVEFVKKGNPLLGICLGMQLLMVSSEEHGHHSGLGLIEGGVFDFSEKLNNLPVPHVGWNEIIQKRKSKILKNIRDGSSFYFVHSFYCDLSDKSQVVATTDYGFNFDSVIEYKNIYGCQFHPEKSQNDGMAILKNFNEI